MKKFKLPKLEDVFLDDKDDNTYGAPGNEGGHYAGKVQPYDLIREQNLGYAEGVIVKCACRYKKKAGLLDLHKIVFFAYQLIDQWVEEHGAEIQDDYEGKRKET